MNKWQQFTTLGWYDGLIEFLFRFVAKTSEPLLAAGLVISAADFLTSGVLMRNNAATSLAWAWTQAIAIEASSGVVFVYALQSFRQADKVKAWLYLVLSILLAFTGGAMLLFQLIANTTGMQESRLPGGLFYALAVLRVLVSVSYVYLCRAKTICFTDLADLSDKPAMQQVVQATKASPTITPEVLNLLIERLDMLSVTVTQLANTPAPALPAPTEKSAANDQQIYEAPIASKEAAAWGRSEISTEEDREQGTGQPIYLDKFASKEQAIAAFLAQKPEATAEEIAQEAGCSVRTAEKWLKRLVTQKGAVNQHSGTTEQARPL